MFSIHSWKVGPRLFAGFGLVLALVALMGGLGSAKLGSIAGDADRILNQSLAKERMIEECYRIVSAGARRNMAIAKGADPTVEKIFTEESKAASVRINALQPQIEPLLSTPDEKALFASIAAKRKVYLGYRDALQKARQGGQAADADRIFDADFRPANDAYLAEMEKLLDWQRRDIDAATGQLKHQATVAIGSTWAIGAAAFLIGIVLAWRITRSISEPLQRAAASAVRVAQGDLTETITVRGNDEPNQVLAAMKTMQSSLGKIVGDVRDGTGELGHATRQIAAGNADLSSRTEQQAGSLQQIASSMDQMSASVRSTSESSTAAAVFSKQAASDASAGGHAMAAVVATMSNINASSKRIGEITSVIDSIAFQTNILALNAAVEAARAGEQGRGFAVVASEVRTLAQRSAEAAKDIRQLIQDSLGKVSAGVVEVKLAGATIDRIVASVDRVSTLISESTRAVGEQSQGLAQVHASIASLDAMTQQNAALVEEATAAAETLVTQASSLERMTAVFKVPARDRVH